MKKCSTGFTIVELLVVIVVIGILAAITIVSYTGISQRAIVASLKSDLSGASTQLKMYQTEYGVFPTMDGNNCPTNPADSKYCLKKTAGNTLVYSSLSPFTAFTLDATNGNTKYRITTNTSATLVAALVLPPNTIDNGNGTWTTTIYGDTSDGVIYSDGTVLNTANTNILVGSVNGDNGFMYQRGYIKFDISTLSGIVSSATLKVYLLIDSIGPESLIVNHIPDYTTLDTADLNTTPLSTNIGVLTTPASNAGYKSLVVTSSVQNDMTNSRSFSSYCLLLNNENDLANEPYYNYYSANSATNRPYILVTWSL